MNGFFSEIMVSRVCVMEITDGKGISEVQWDRCIFAGGLKNGVWPHLAEVGVTRCRRDTGRSE